jgi:hypothetical protein
VEPNCVTALKCHRYFLRIAFKENPPNVDVLLYVVKACDDVKLVRPPVAHRLPDRGVVAASRLHFWKDYDRPALFDAFDGCFAKGTKAKEAAQTFIKTLRPTLSAKGIKKSASRLLHRLKAMPAADRKRLKDFGKFCQERHSEVEAAKGGSGKRDILKRSRGGRKGKKKEEKSSGAFSDPLTLKKAPDPFWIVRGSCGRGPCPAPQGATVPELLPSGA